MEDSDTGSQNQRASEIIDGGVLDADGGATEPDGGQLGGGGQVAKFRNWTLTKLGHAVEAGIRTPNPSLDTRLRVLSYNVLAPVYAVQHRHLYRGTQEDHLDWAARWRRLRAEVAALQPDLVTLQEVQFSSGVFKRDIEPWFLQMDYGGVAKQRTNGRDDGCAIFYRNTKFRKLYSEDVEYNRHIPGLLDKDNVGLAVVLASAGSGALLTLATTHLLFSPKRGEVRLAQTALLLAHLDAITWNSSSGQHGALLLTGDFNLAPGSAPHLLLARGWVDHGRGLLLPPGLGVADTCQLVDRVAARDQQVVLGSGTLSHPLGLRSVHEEEGGVSTRHEAWLAVDHIFYSASARLRLLGKLGLPSSRQMALVGGIPNQECPSDHLPLVADFLLTSSPSS